MSDCYAQMVMPILLLFGAVGESLHLLTLTRYTNERRHSGTHTLCYLKAICIADLLSIVTLVPFVSRHIVAGDQQHYEYQGSCRLIVSVKNISTKVPSTYSPSTTRTWSCR